MKPELAYRRVHVSFPFALEAGIKIISEEVSLLTFAPIHTYNSGIRMDIWRDRTYIESVLPDVEMRK